MKLIQIAAIAGLAVLFTVLVIGCNPPAEPTTGETGNPSSAAKADYSGQKLDIDGSGTVYPIGAAFTEMFLGANPGVEITVGKAGTGAGMEKFEKGETMISNASRPIKDSEMEKLAAAGIEFIEVPIAYDGICIVVNPKNTWLKSITIEQLNKMWNQDSKVKMWSDVDPTWPKEEIKLYGPTDAHGTYEYFNEVVNGKKDNVRSDYSQQAEYDTLITGVANEPNALGYVGYAYVEQNMDKLRIIPVDGGKGPITPSKDTIIDGTYAPFSRPLFMYVSKKAMDSSSLCKDFVMYCLGENAAAGVEAAQYIPFPTQTYGLIKARVEKGMTGSLFSKAEPGKTLDEVLAEAH